MLSKKIKKILAVSMALSMLFCNNTFATPIDLANSIESVATDTLNKTEGTNYFEDEITNEWLDGQINEEVRVTVDLESQFEITIPKDIVLNGETGTASYVVNAKGDIAGNQKLNVVPEPDFILSEAGGKADVTATVTQDDTEYIYTDLQGDGTNYNGSISAILTAGEWSGKFAFNITFEGEGSISIPEAGRSLEAYSWAEITAISEAGLAQDYFSIGDEKKITLNSTSTTGVNTLADTGETYTLQIIGLNHDDLADGSGKAGITFGLKEIMNDGNNRMTKNVGWADTEMRRYLNNEIYNSLPIELKNNIKEVNKLSDGGQYNQKIITTVDKLFIFSSEEVNWYNGGWYSTAYVRGQGTRYEFFQNADNFSNKTNLEGTVNHYWLRSTCTYSADYPHYAININIGNNLTGIVFGFCI